MAHFYMLRSSLEKRQIVLSHETLYDDAAFHKAVFDVAVEATVLKQKGFRRLADFADIMEAVADLLVDRFGFARVEYSSIFAVMGFCGPGLLGPDRARYVDSENHPFGEAGRNADQLADWLRAHDLRDAADAQDLAKQLEVVTEGEKAMRAYLSRGSEVVLEPVDRHGVKGQHIEIIAEQPFGRRRRDRT